MDGFNCPGYWIEFLHLCFRCYIEVFSYCSVKEMFAVGIQNCFDPAVLMKELFISSENQIVRFQGFVLIVFWDSTSYTIRIVFWMMSLESVKAPARWWPCACLNWVSGLCRLENAWIFSDAYISLTWCSKFVQT